MIDIDHLTRLLMEEIKLSAVGFAPHRGMSVGQWVKFPVGLASRKLRKEPHRARVMRRAVLLLATS